MSAVKRLVVTLGDPAGIGPEVTERAAARFLASRHDVSLVLVGPANLVEPMCERLGSKVCRAAPVESFTGAVGEPSAESGRAALSTLMRGIELCRLGEACALVTAPISKHALSMAGSEDRGHTEILTRELALGPTAMAFFSEKLRTALVTTHLPLRRAIESITASRIVEVAQLLHRALVDYLGIKSPRLALAALNPHAGEAGLLGEEEDKILRPAVYAAEERGLLLSGPHPADTLFCRAVSGEYDGVVALYHDQALIPVKLLAFGRSTNVTLGLSVPRTSPDHGTAYDIAGQNRARPDGMMAALETAVLLASKAYGSPSKSPSLRIL